MNRYITSVDRVESSALLSLGRARDAYAGLSRGTVTKQQLRDLATAPHSIRTLRTQIAAVAPPADAGRLRIALLKLLDLDAAFAVEVDQFALYVHGVAPVEKQIGSDTARLRSALHRSQASLRERRALSRYAAELNTVLIHLKRLSPPPALAPWHAQQAARVTTLRKGALELATGLARRDTALVRRGLTALTGAAATSPVTVADRAAIVAYDARLKRIGAASGGVADEERRLAKELS